MTSPERIGCKQLAPAIALCVTLCAVGCLRGGAKTDGSGTSESGTLVSAASDVTPDALPYSHGMLILGGDASPVEMERTQGSDWVKFVLKKGKEVIEEEDYQIDATGFRFHGVRGESYEPPIPLLRFPMHVGDSWTWSGRVHSEDVAQASAKVTTRSEMLNLAGGPYSTIRAHVALVLDSNSPDPVKRELVFWFVPKKGIIKRDFGAISTREPATSPTKSKTR